MEIFSRQKKEKKLVLVFDIGSSSVGGSLFEIEKSGIPKILEVFREPIIFREKVDIDQFLFLTIKSLEIVASKLCLKGIGKPSQIFCILSSPWYVSSTRIIKFEKNTPFLFTSKLAEDLIKKEIALFKEEHLAQFSHPENKIKLIEFKNIKIMLNGYETSNPLDKKIEKLEIIIFLSISGDLILKQIEKTILKHFHVEENIKFFSFIMALFSITRDLFSHEDNFLLVDIGGEVTDISMVKKNALGSSVSFPLGRNFIIRKVADNLHCTLSEAKSFISLYKDGHAVESTFKKIEPVMSRIKTEWLKEFEKSLINISDDFSIPSTIFITIDPDLIDFFSKIIKNEQFSQYNLTDSGFKIIFLDSKIFHEIVTFKDGVNRDLFLTLESIFINRFIC